MPAVSPDLAASSSSNSGGGLGFLVFAVLVIGALSLLVRRANSRRRQYAEQLQSAAGPGKQVMMTSGIYGTVVEEQDDRVVVSVAPGVELTFAKAAIARVLADDDPPVTDGAGGAGPGAPPASGLDGPDGGAPGHRPG